MNRTQCTKKNKHTDIKTEIKPRPIKEKNQKINRCIYRNKTRNNNQISRRRRV